MSPASSFRSIPQSLQEYGRGIAGGLMFSLPLLYTMEIWQAGFNAHPWRLAAALAATFILLIGYNRHAGLREDAGYAEVLIDSVEELGIGLVVAAGMLFLLGRLDGSLTWNEAVGQITIAGMTVAIGVSVGTAQLGSGEGERDAGMCGEGPAEVDFSGQLVIALCGAMLFAVNVAPTDEISVIAREITTLRLLGLAAASLLLGAFILYYAEFRNTDRHVHHDGWTNTLRGTVITYAAALVVSAAILWFFGRFDGESLHTAVAQTVVLGVAATLGASAGRLLLQ